MPPPDDAADDAGSASLTIVSLTIGSILPAKDAVAIDEATNATVAAGMLRSAPKDIPQPEYEGYMI